MPARRALAHELQVSRNTIDAAVRFIEKDGLIKPVSRHRSEIVRVRRKSAATHPDRIVYLDGRCLEDCAPLYRVELLVFQQLVQSKGYGFILQTNLAGHTVYTPHILKDWIRNERAICWFLAYQPPKIQKYFEEAGICSIVVGARAEGVNLPCLDFDQLATARHAGRRLEACGHRKIAFFRPRRDSSDVSAMEAGFKQAASGATLATFQTFAYDLSEDSMARCLSGALRKFQGMDAIITTCAADAMRCLGYLGVSGQKESVTLVSLEGDPIFEWLQPAISHYQMERHLLARKLNSLVDRRSRLNPKDRILISPRQVLHFASRI